jgi:predicted flap endonuclease-1-like 5' DNA nuclease
MARSQLDNNEVADILEHVADLLETRRNNPFRIRSYRNAAQAVRDHDESLAQMVDSGETRRLEDISGIGPKLAGAIEEIVQTGRLGLLDRLESEVTPETVLSRVPGIGKKLASRIHTELGVGNLEELEIAAHGGSLARLDGLGEKKITGIKNALAGMLSRSAGRRSRQRQKDGTQVGRPGAALLLEIDAEYRTKAEAGKLRRIAPRRFNRKGEAWLPILKTEREGWEFTALYSNTSRAHQLGRTHDWVVIYFGKGGEERQNTIVTAEKGPLKGKRVVRGRERETKEHYDSSGK